MQTHVVIFTTYQQFFASPDCAKIMIALYVNSGIFSPPQKVVGTKYSFSAKRNSRQKDNISFFSIFFEFTKHLRIASLQASRHKFSKTTSKMSDIIIRTPVLASERRRPAVDCEEMMRKNKSTPPFPPSKKARFHYVTIESQRLELPTFEDASSQRRLFVPIMDLPSSLHKLKMRRDVRNETTEHFVGATPRARSSPTPTIIPLTLDWEGDTGPVAI